MTSVVLLLGLLIVVFIGGGIWSAFDSRRDRFAAQRALRAAYVRAGETPPSYL